MDYLKEAMKGSMSKGGYDKIVNRFRSQKLIKMLHSAMGITTEAGELMDQLKRHTIYGSELDEINLMEELGDILWYIALMANTLNVSIEDLQQMNIAKLKVRYGGEFSEDKAKNHDVSLERTTLEKFRPKTPG